MARVDAYAGTGVEWLEESETQSPHRQNLYADTYWRLVLLAMKQSIGNGRAYV